MTEEIRITGTKRRLNVTLSATNLTLTGQESNICLGGEKPRHGAAFSKINFWHEHELLLKIQSVPRSKQPPSLL